VKVGLLTSSRADYGIYLPLIRLMDKDPEFELNLIIFGTHLSKRFGKTILQIEKNGFQTDIKVNTLSKGDNPLDISVSMATTMREFANIWKKSQFDLIFALGDRYEMFAAVASSLPYNIPVAHIHGGETTNGAIDNAFRHSITCMSKYHFTSTEKYRKRVAQIIDSEEEVFNVGALSIDNLKSIQLLNIDQFVQSFQIDLSIPTILFTFHPETVNYTMNSHYIKEIIITLSQLDNYQQLITMPNADTLGLFIRKQLLEYAKNRNNVKCYETLGTVGYLSAIKHCSFMLGNTSSGFVEAAFFPKAVINFGERQSGRIQTPNILTVPISTNEILKAVEQIETMSIPSNCNIYGDGTAASKIVEIIKNKFK